MSSRSTAGRRSTGRRPAVDVYLLPAIVGGGLGDIEEVLAAGRRLARAGARLLLYRAPGHPWPAGVDGPWAWPPLLRTGRPRPRATAALTISPAWGISAAPAGPPPLGRPGPWDVEARAIEAAYPPDRVVHASLEEFGRTLTVAEEHRERFREGGVPARALGRRAAAARRAGEAAAYARAFRRFRAFDRPDVLHLFATFAPSPAFARAFPAAVQTGPLWPGRGPRRSRRRPARREWVWYASPASAERIAPAVAATLGAVAPKVRLFVRAPRRWAPSTVGTGRVELRTTPLPPPAWAARFASAELRIVTGSRSLLEALELGGPFLYFNGVLGDGAARRRHRPEKIVGLLRAARRAGWPVDLRRDLADFARGRRVAEIVERAARRRGGWGGPWPRLGTSGFAPPFDDAGAVLLQTARALARRGASARAVVARLRAGSNP